MQIENLTEYKLIREEALRLKDCVTNYISFVLGGSGLAVFGIAAIGVSDENIIALVSVILSFVFSLVMVILLYKFNSHNRFAAYSKLLSQECFSEIKTPLVKGTQVVAWEFCMDLLHRSDSDLDQFESLLVDPNIEMTPGGLENLRWVIRFYGGPNPRSDKQQVYRGLGHLARALFGVVKTNSWAFPAYVVSVFFVLISSFILYGLYQTVRFQIGGEYAIGDQYIIWGIWLMVFVIQVLLWSRFCGKLYTLMEGSATVEGFFWRFVLIRSTYLGAYGIKPTYKFVEGRLKEIHDNSDPNDPVKPD